MTIKRLILPAVVLAFVGRLFSPQPGLAAESWKQEWEKTLDAAKRDGEVVIYGPHNPMYRPLWDTPNA